MGLTDIQKEIIILVIEGKTNKQIADRLGWSIDKIKKELKIIYKIFKIKTPDAHTKRAILVREITRIEMSKLML